MKQIIKWAGGKSWLCDFVKEKLKKSNETVLVEPFCGSCSVTFNIKPECAVLNDFNFPLINFFKQLQNGFDINQLIKKVKISEENYYLIRSKFNNLKKDLSDQSDLESLAFYFYYLNKLGFNGLYRENKLGDFNVPWNKKTSLPTISVPCLKNYKFVNRSYEELTVKGFLFVDPPYVDGFVEYNGRGFNDHENVIKWTLSQNCPFVLTNKASDATIDLFSSYGLQFELMDAPRRIGKNRKPVKEIVAWN